MQVETQMNMKSQATGVRRSSDGIDPGLKKNKRIKLSHNPLENSTDQNDLLEESDSFENSMHLENEKDINTSSMIAEEQMYGEAYKNGHLHDSYINGSLSNGDRSTYEENLSNGDLVEEKIFENIKENESIAMDAGETQDLPPPTLELQCNDNYDHYSSNTSEASEKTLDSLKDFDESCQKDLPCYSEKELPGPDASELESIPQISENKDIEETTSSEIPKIVQPSESEVQVPSPSCSQSKIVSPPEEVSEDIKTDEIKYLGIYDLKTTILEGHADVIYSVAANDKVVISSSGDTTVKVWNVEEQMELQNFAGHSDGVTSVILLDSEQSKVLGEKFGCSDVSSIAISASMDCHIKVWSVYDAKELSSIYTYNSITTMDYLQSELCVILGTEGGKLEVWDLHEKKKVDSAFAHESSVSTVKVCNNYAYSASADGTVKVWLLEDSELQPIYSRRRRETSTRGVDMGPTHWKSLAVSNDTLFLGDSTSYMKVLDWKLGRLNLLVNQMGRHGVCDAVLADECILLSTTFDSMTDTAGINVWSLPEMIYIGTLSGDLQDICCLAMTRFENKLRIISGGHQLIVWDFDLKKPSNNSSNAAFSFCEIEGVGVEVNEKVVKIPIQFSGVSPSEVNNNVEDRRSRCNIF